MTEALRRTLQPRPWLGCQSAHVRAASTSVGARSTLKRRRRRLLWCFVAFQSRFSCPGRPAASAVRPRLDRSACRAVSPVALHPFRAAEPWLLAADPTHVRLSAPGTAPWFTYTPVPWSLSRLAAFINAQSRHNLALFTATLPTRHWDLATHRKKWLNIKNGNRK